MPKRSIFNCINLQVRAQQKRALCPHRVVEFFHNRDNNYYNNNFEKGESSFKSLFQYSSDICRWISELVRLRDKAIIWSHTSQSAFN